MAEPNRLLRTARESVPSPYGSGEPLTRQELAELVNAWLHDHTGRLVELDANYIGKLEQGIIRRPQDRDRRAAFRSVLGVPTDVELGFRRSPRSGSTLGDMDRQQFIRTTLGVAAGTVLGQSALVNLIAPTQPLPVPATVGLAEVAEVRATAAAFAGWDALYGGGVIRQAVHVQLQHYVSLLGARAVPEVRSELFSAVGYFSHVAGFMAFDAYAHDDARRMFQLALSCAEEAGDWHWRAKILSSLARQAIWCGDPDTGLTYTELAMVRADRLTATERAMLHVGRARALAKLGRVEETAAAVGVADEEFANRRPAEDPPWMAYYDHAQHHGDTGHALWDTALRGSFVGAARHRLAIATEGHADRHARSRAMSQIKLASLVMATGDPAEAAVLGGQALDWSGPIRSRRAADDLGQLRGLAQAHGHRDDVAELSHRIGTVIG
ncbi:XRE family transcriptional regulator [Actinokineospora sp. NBRC 105648]|uniref:XRE family transcriptional regulator n=1 Tax=Actinokineospora sp. NBRC 105648 TaxID=3032206 RepID=UPI0024A5B496|nr:XRE family transcriptional regulator [Actinokineospora sp. NBRC 105648]GLZ38188.1 hypothetical protein Acsp05_18120 [Actinokineospora sp. NBRC 105648]